MTLENHAAEQHRTIAIVSPIKEMGGNKYMEDAKGNLVPLEMVKPEKKLEDDTVRRMIAYGLDLNAQISRFLGHCYDDIGAFEVILDEKYEAKRGGEKGNMTLTSFDGCMRVTVQVADLFRFGPELQIAKKLVDECLKEWTDGSRAEIRAVIGSAFNTDKEGQINRTEIIKLLQLAIDDERWLKAMDAIRAAMFVIGTKSYIRLHMRENPKGKWQAISIDLAKAGA
ncbi:MAG: DUF3164 family protein [Rhizobiaceae bacterium]